ncbi:unnamed protein product [Kuraishia capsulata CBS 1993]|uniref:PPM-type phosphatase domain-containing protein n=1 Tax=Kuraishia capsulata CBS 1993 TaxID=1382522 RepID=W6MIA0_9ASCO|nr:uncharacterized protein KUCA_T00002135001 [Kuraishia capsulata CBS 1993]CDK26164.1 unnamed protein product [Kuraishia capsulata CBS 1993]
MLVVTVRPRAFFLTKRLLKQACVLSKGSTPSPGLKHQFVVLSNKQTSHYSTASRPQYQSRAMKNLKFVSGVGVVVIAGVYMSVTNNYFSSDTIPGAGIGTTAFSTSSSQSSPQPQGKNGLYVYSGDAITRRLREGEESYFVDRGNGVLRYDVCQFASNNPIEDDRSEKIVQVPLLDQGAEVNTDWMFWGVFDGHGGWATSKKLKESLLGCLISELSDIYTPSEGNKDVRIIPSPHAIEQALKSGFLKMDNEIVNESVAKLMKGSTGKAGAAELLMPALSGSCGLVSFYDTHSQMLNVAVTGDSRALLGSLNEKGEWTVKALSVDQTGSNPDEVNRIRQLHPNEPNVIRSGRVLGSLEPSRAFGDARYKWDKETQARISSQFFGRNIPNNLISPPYVTAEPVVSTSKVNPRGNDFMVMASDGLYEMLSNEEIVGLVVKWMESSNMIKQQKPSIFSMFGSSDNSTGLPIVHDVTDGRSAKQQKQPFRKHGNSKGYFLEDENVSTHLIRNALGNGGSKEDLAMLVSIPSPLSRRYRDDLTVTVVFFGEPQGTVSGKMEINGNATKGGLQNAQAKL